jgi:hypothetical protein
MGTKNESDQELPETSEATPGNGENLRILACEADQMHCPVCGTNVRDLTLPRGEPEAFFFICKCCMSETLVRFPLDLMGDPERTV